MSYDLMVFEASAAPRNRAAFMAWYAGQTRWQEDHGYADPAICSPALADWYVAMADAFPNLNGPDMTDADVDHPNVTGYTFGRDVIYADFRWTVAEEAYEAVRRHAIGCRVGFYDVSGDEGDGEVMFPGDVPRAPSHGGWRSVAAEFRDLGSR